MDEETIIKNLSNLGRTADGTKLSYLSLSLPGFSLKEIKSLAKFKELQTLELSHNQLKGRLTNKLKCLYFLICLYF